MWRALALADALGVDSSGLAAAHCGMPEFVVPPSCVGTVLQ